MIFDLKVNGQRKADGISTVSPVFSWECETERQFTVHYWRVRSGVGEWTESQFTTI